MSVSEFFIFGNNTNHNRQFTWAWRIYPRSELIHQVCSECGVIEQYPSGSFDVELEGGTKYPDVLGCGEFPFLIVSETVVETWREEHVTRFHTYEVGVAKVRSRALEQLAPPRYYRVEIDGRCGIDLAGSGVKIIQMCSECHHLVTHPPLMPGFCMTPNSWDGSHLFRDVELFPRVSFCTKLVLELAHKRNHTNFRFESMEGPFQPADKGIDYLGGT
jgi:hypothetical protein